MSTALRTYYRGANLVSLREHPTGQTRYYHSDYQGTTQCLTDSSGAVTDRFACDAWGVEVKRTGKSLNRQWYIGNWGYYRQVDQALEYIRARYLGTALGQWLSVDPLLATGAAKGQMKYAYASANPVRSADPSGLVTEERYTTGGKCKHPTKGMAVNNCYCGYKADRYLSEELNRYRFWALSFPKRSKCYSHWNPALRPLMMTFQNMCYKARYASKTLYCWHPGKPPKGKCANTVSLGGRCVDLATLGNITFSFAIWTMILEYPFGHPVSSAAWWLNQAAIRSDKDDQQDLQTYEYGKRLAKQGRVPTAFNLIPYEAIWGKFRSCKTTGHACARPLPKPCALRFAAVFWGSGTALETPNELWTPIGVKPEIFDPTIDGRDPRLVHCRGDDYRFAPARRINNYCNL